LENWADLLPFVPRRQLLSLLFKLDDRRFASILQYCLNEDGHITLGHLCIRAPYFIDDDGPIVQLTKDFGCLPILETPLPDEPIPKNVHNFNLLTIRFGFKFTNKYRNVYPVRNLKLSNSND
jgi:hypothetical protein